MSTLGQKPATQHVSTEKQTITGNGGTSYTLQQSVSQASDIEVFVNNTRQEPTVAYTASGKTLTMTGAVNSSDSFYVIFQGKAIQTAGLPVDAAISASTVTTSQTITSTGNITTSGTINTPSINGGQIGGRRNIVINGAMQVAQRSTSVTGLGDGDEGYVTVDRVRHTAAASAGRFTSAQTAISDLPGFLNCLHLDCTTSDTSISSGELLKLEYRMEGQDVQQLKKGTSDAEKITVSFYMKTNKAFTFMCELDDRDNNRVNTQQFTTSTSFTRHVLTFDGDTTGALDNDANASLSVGIYLHAGSDFTGGTYSANTWQSRQTSDNMRAVGIGSFYDSTDNDVKITGLQVEVGSQATLFEYRSFGEELELCKRYFQKTGNVSGNAYTPLTPYFDAATTSAGYCPIPLRPKMRLGSAIAVSHSGVGTLGLSIGTGTSAVSAVALQAAQSGEDFITIKFTSSDTLTQYRPMRVYANNDATAFIAFDAEL